jgi:lipopolysaccharide export system protein LptA
MQGYTLRVEFQIAFTRFLHALVIRMGTRTRHRSLGQLVKLPSLKWRQGLMALGFGFTLFTSLGAGVGLSQAARQPLTLKADVQQLNAVTGVVTVRGNVRLLYPSRQIEATAAQGQYFSRERRIVLSGNVYVLQAGNSLRAESVTYLMDEGRFVALPQTSQQVESIILIQDRNTTPLSP